MDNSVHKSAIGRAAGVSKWLAVAFMLIGAATFAHAAASGEPEISDLASDLGVRTVGDAFRTTQGIMLCLELESGGWIGWYPARPANKSPASPRCEVQPGASAADPLVDFPPVVPNAPIHRDAAFSGAKSIVLQTEGYTHCGPIFPTSYSVTFADGSHSEFYIIVKLRKALLVQFDAACDFADGKAGRLNLEYDVVTTLSSIDASSGKTVLYAWNGLQQAAVLLLARQFPLNIWTNNGTVFVIPTAVLRPELDAAGADPRARYRALLHVIGRPAGSQMKPQ